MYDEAKRFGEALTVAFARTYAVDARIVRIFNTYGPNSDPCDGRLVPNFVVQALKGDPLTVYGDGSQTRSLCYVSDLVEALRLAATCPRARGEVINLGNPEEHTILEFAALIRAAAQSASAMRFVPHAVGDDPRQRRPDISRARRLLGWEPRVSLQDGLTKTVEYFRNELGIRVTATAPTSP
jgi:nucleoside-diphosphate-sugar epimerase